MTKVIEKNIPFPNNDTKGTFSKYGFHKISLEVGDSITYDTNLEVKSFLSHFFTKAKRNGSKEKYVSRKVADNQWRIWRVK